jgi:transcription elongation regulator 1
VGGPNGVPGQPPTAEVKEKKKKKEKPKQKVPIPNTTWVRVTTSEGNVFYFESESKKSEWTIPDEIKDEVEAMDRAEQEEKEKEERERRAKEDAERLERLRERERQEKNTKAEEEAARKVFATPSKVSVSVAEGRALFKVRLLVRTRFIVELSGL